MSLGRLVTWNPDGRPCPMRSALVNLAADGALGRLAHLSGKRAPDGASLCHDLAIALMLDLVDAGCADSWTWVNGAVSGHGAPIEHSWNEFDGWAFDASQGTAVIAETELYRGWRQAQVNAIRDGAATVAAVLARNPSTKFLLPRSAW